MRFTTNITNLEKKAIYDRVIADLERQIMAMAIQLGHDPETFNEDDYEATMDPVSGDPVRQEQLLQDAIAALKSAQAKRAEL